MLGIKKRKNQANGGQKIAVAANAILEAMIDGVGVADVNGNIIQANNALARMLGFRAPKDTIGENIISFMAEKDIPKVMEDFKKCLTTGITTNFQFSIKTKDGTEFPCLLNASVLRDEKGGSVGLIAAMRDITGLMKTQQQAHKAAASEAAAKEAEAGRKRVEIYLESMIDGVGITDIKGNLVQGNRALAKMHGYESIEEMIGKSVTAFTKETDIPRVLPVIKQCWEKGILRDCEFTHVTKQGKELPVSLNVTALKDEKGQLAGTIAVIRDVTERKKIEEALRESEEKYKRLFEEITDAIFVADAETGIVTDCNRAASELVGRERAELIGQHQRILHPPEEIEEGFSRTFKQHLKEKEGQVLEDRVITKKGEIKDVAIRANHFEFKGRKLIQAVFRDITKRKQAEAELKEAQEKLIETARRAGMAEVAADVLHNVGNVLNSINVSTTMIKEKVTSSEVANLEKVASIINEHTDDLGTFLTEHPQGKHIPVYLTEVSKCLTDEQTDIIDKLKVLTENIQHIKDIVGMQQDYTKVSGAEVQTSLSKLAEDAIQINSAGLERHGARLIREFEELGDVEIDKQKVLQILVNLVSNAKYALSGSNREEKLLTIRIYKHCEERFRIEVADNGVGISEDNLAKIFSYGFTTKKDGHGVGLHSSALAAKEMGGTLTVYSEGLGQGATFTLELPFKPVEVMK